MSGIAGRLGPRLVTASFGQCDEDPTPVRFTVEEKADTAAPKADDRAAWIDPIRALEAYFGVLQTMLDANRQFVMGLAGVLFSSGTRLRGGLDSTRTKP